MFFLFLSPLFTSAESSPKLGRSSAQPHPSPSLIFFVLILCDKSKFPFQSLAKFETATNDAAKNCHIFVLCQHGCRRYSHLRWLGIFLVNPIDCFRTKKTFSASINYIKKDAILQMFEQGIYVCKKKRKK